MRDMFGLMKQAQEMQAKMQEMQAELDLIEVEGQAGGGMVRVTLPAKGQMKGLAIDDQLLKADEKVVEATFENDAPSVNGLAADPSVRRIVRAGRLLRAFVRGNSDEVARHIATLEPKSLRVLDQNLEDIFLNAVAASDGDAAAAAANLEG